MEEKNKQKKWIEKTLEEKVQTTREFAISSLQVTLSLIAGISGLVGLSILNGVTQDFGWALLGLVGIIFGLKIYVGIKLKK